MMLLHRLAAIVRWIARRDRAERDLDDELRAFAEMAAADALREGASPGEARRQAALQLGGVEQAKERVRTYRHGGVTPTSRLVTPSSFPRPAFCLLRLSAST